MHKRYYQWQNKPVPFWNNSLAIVLVGLTALQLLCCHACGLWSSSVTHDVYFIRARESKFSCTSLLTDWSNGGVKGAVLWVVFCRGLRQEKFQLEVQKHLYFFSTKRAFKYWSRYLKGLWNLHPWRWLRGWLGDDSSRVNWTRPKTWSTVAWLWAEGWTGWPPEVFPTCVVLIV